MSKVVEVGEKTDPSTSSGTGLQFKDVFGTMVSGYYNPSVMDDAKLLAWINGDGARGKSQDNSGQITSVYRIVLKNN